jgi:RNA polymerase sigma-70 factor (ECF subfamily)
MLFLFGLTRRRAIDAPLAAVSPSDSELVREAQANPAHFTALYERYLEQIYSYCYVRLGRHEVAEDATSEIFLKVFAALPRYRDQMFAAWLFRIAHNVVINIQRQTRPGAVLELESLPDPAPGMEQTLIEATQRQDFRSALAQLPDEQRTVLELDCADLSGAQIAAAMGKSDAAVRMLRHRAILRLKQIIANEEIRQ